MKVRTWLMTALLAAGAGTAAAQEPDDSSFAKKLAYRGWFDLAGEVCARMEKDLSLPREARSALPILLAEIELAKADRESDPDKAMKYIDSSIAMLNRFITEEDSHPRIYEAYINIGFLKSRKAKMLVDQLEKTNLPADHDRLRKQAIALYKELAAEFDVRVGLWKRLPTSPETDGAIMDARLEAERARYETARIPGVDDNERKQLLADAVKNLVDYEMDYGNTAKGFEGMLLEARCLFEQGEYSQAEVKLKSTMVLKEVLAEHEIARNPYFDQIIFGAYLTLAQVYVKANKPKEARDFIDGLFKTDPVVGREWIGNALKVEKVDALFKLKQEAAAKKLAEEVIASDQDGPFGRLMRNKLRDIGTKFRLEPKEAIRAGEGSMERGRFREAMITFRQAVENCVTEAQKAEELPQALYLMGQCLQEMKRNYEAAMTFERVFQTAPKCKQAPLALWQAVICFSEEFDTFADPADERDKNRVMAILVERFKDHPVTDNIYYLQGRTLEAQKKLVDAAAKYQSVPERATAHERALVRAGYCLRADAFRQYAKLKGKDPAAEQAILDQLNKAEALFKKFLKRVETVQVQGQEATRDRASLILAVNQELAYLYNHKLVGKAKEALEFLDKVARDIPPDDERMARIHLLQIQSHLVLNQSEQAVQIMDLMYDRFPHLQETAQACKSVAIRLDEITTEHLKKQEAAGKGKELDDLAKENFKKISRYYKKWMDGAMLFGLDARVTDVQAVANTLYVAAMRLNGLDPNETRSFIDLRKNQIVAWKNYFEDAEFILSLLVSDRFKGKYPDKERIFLAGLRARCLSFIADSPERWGRAKNAYDEIIKEFGVVNAKGDFDPKVLGQHPFLVTLYIELGYAYFELGRSNKIHYDNAITTFTNVTSVSMSGGEPWWHSRFGALQAYFYRGKERDIMTAQIGIKMIQDNYKDFDGNKYGMKEKFEELQRRLAMMGGSK